MPRVSVIVAARAPPPSAAESLASIAAQSRFDQVEVIVADGSPDGALAALASAHPGMRRLPLPGGNLPALKGSAIREARGEFVAVLDPSDAAEPNWIDEMLAAFADPGVAAVGGSVLLAGPATPGNVAGYLFEYGAFNPPLAAGDTEGDLPGNNVAYRRALLVGDCADLLEAEGFYKPLFHERIRALGGRLVIRPAMRVRHLTRHAFGEFGARRWHYGRCFGALRFRRASAARKALYFAAAPAAIPLLAARHLARAWRHPGNRRLLPGAALALVGVCAYWGAGEWLGCWFGPGRSCEELY